MKQRGSILDSGGYLVCQTEQQAAALSYQTERGLRSRLWFIVLVALTLRLIVVSFLAVNQLDPVRGHWKFGWETGRIASSLASGHGFGSPLFGETGATGWMAPIYPCLLAGIFKIFGIYTKASAYVILSLNCLFAALTCQPLHAIARKVCGGTVATAAAWTWALFPYSINFAAGLVWNTTLNAFLLTSAISLTLSMERRLGTWTWIGWGSLWALIGLTEPSLLTCLPVAGLWLVFRLRRRGMPWIAFWRPALAALAFLVFVSPWFLRNYRVFGQLLPFRSNFWLTFYQGNTWDTFDLYPDWANPPHNPTEMADYARVGEVAYMSEKKQQAIAEIREYPARFAWTTLRRIVFTWTGYWNLSRAYRGIEPFALPNVLMTTTLSLLSSAGLVLTFAYSRRHAILFAWLFLAFPCVYYVTHPSMEYRHPLDPFLVLLAVYSVIERGTARETRNVRSTVELDFALQTLSSPSREA